MALTKEYQEKLKRGFTVHDVIAAGYSLEPMVCLFCGSHEVSYNTVVSDAACSDCGMWQLEEEHSRWVIFNRDEVDDGVYEDEVAAFWNNEDGWTELCAATVFNTQERVTLNLAIGGQWMRLPL